MSEPFKFVVYDRINLGNEAKLLLGVHDGIGLFAMMSIAECDAEKVRAGSTIVATEAVLSGEPKAYWEQVNDKGIVLKSGEYKNPQQEIEIGSNWCALPPVRQASTLVAPRQVSEELRASALATN